MRTQVTPNNHPYEVYHAYKQGDFKSLSQDPRPVWAAGHTVLRASALGGVYQTIDIFNSIQPHRMNLDSSD